MEQMPSLLLKKNLKVTLLKLLKDLITRIIIGNYENLSFRGKSDLK